MLAVIEHLGLLSAGMGGRRRKEEKRVGSRIEAGWAEQPAVADRAGTLAF
jgi:hypothetical protein